MVFKNLFTEEIWFLPPRDETDNVDNKVVVVVRWFVAVAVGSKSRHFDYSDNDLIGEKVERAEGTGFNNYSCEFGFTNTVEWL